MIRWGIKIDKEEGKTEMRSSQKVLFCLVATVALSEVSVLHAGVEASVLWQEPKALAHQPTVGQDRLFQSKWGTFTHYLGNECETASEWNAKVESFDVGKFADGIAATGARFHFFTIMQGKRWMCAPNAAYDRIAGTKPGEACSQRDLVSEIAVALQARGIDLYLYFTGDGPYQDVDIGPRFGFGKTRGTVSDEFVRKWASVMEEYAVRYGTKVCGWWIDGCSRQYFKYTDSQLDLYRLAAKKGNSDAVVAFNDGVRDYYYKSHPSEDFTAGESNHLTMVPRSRFIDGAQAFILAPIGIPPDGDVWNGWCKSGCRYNAKYLRDYVDVVNANGGVVALDIYLGPDGSLQREQVELLQALPARSSSGLRQQVSSSALFAPDRFTPLNIVPLMLGNESAQAARASDYVEQTGNPIVLYMMTLHPEGNPARAKLERLVESYRKFAQALNGTKARPGVLIQAVLGHWPRVDKDVEKWQRSINVDGAPVRFCPLDPCFRAYIREMAVLLAREHPCLILTDDDMRSFSPKAECFCPLHTAEYNRRTGQNLTSDAYRAFVASIPFGDVRRKAFDDLQRDTILGVCRLIREGIDSVDPAIPAGVCMPGWGEEHSRIADYSRAIAAKGQVPFLRLCNGQYEESTPKTDLYENVLRTMAFIEDLGGGTSPYLLDESDTWPQNPWSKSAAAMHAKLAANVFCGLKGAKIWFVNCLKNGYPISRNYTDVLAAHRGYYDALAKLSLETNPSGVIVPTRELTHVNWAGKVFGWVGVPVRTSHDLTTRGVYALAGGGGDVGKYTNAELIELLHGRLLLDGNAAGAFISRGLGEYIGLASSSRKIRFTDERDERTGDYITFPETVGAPVFDPLPGATVLSSLVWRPYSGADTFERVAPAATLFRNKLGGTVLVTAYHMGVWPPYTHSESRRAWLERRLGDLNGMPMDNLAVTSQNTFVLERKAADGADIVMFSNTNFDPAREIVLTRAMRPISVEELSSNGIWRAADWSWDAGRLVVKGELPCYCEKFLRIRQGQKCQVKVPAR